MRNFFIIITTLFLLLLNEATIVNAGDRSRFGAKWQDAKNNTSRKPALKNKLASVKPGGRQGAFAGPAAHGMSLQKAASAKLIYSENFDAGAPGWTFHDLWSEAFWHVSTTGALSGYSYWCGIEELGGYDDGWTQILTSPAIDLAGTTSPQLTFMHDYSLEPPPDQVDYYDAWDAVNVRLSTDGAAFEVIQPAGGYPYSNAAGFHLYYGAGVEGWSGASNGYVSATFDLSAYAGQKIWLRFELASDEAVAHEDDPSLWGWRVDNIEIKDGATRIFFDDAGDTGTAQFVAGGPGGPSLWHITGEAYTSAPKSAGCFDAATGNYLPRMNAGLTSPAIAIDALPPDTWVLIPDFQVQGSLDPTIFGGGSFPIDFFYVQARAYYGGIWSYWYVITFADVLPSSFAGFNETAPYFPMDATGFIGADSIQFQIGLLTQPDGRVVPPANAFVDDFTLFSATEADLLLGPKFKAFFERVTTAPTPQRSAIVDSFMATIPSYPFVEEKTIAYFLYRGNANSVNVPGDANGWDQNAFPMNKISGTNLWYWQAVFEPDARLDYKFVLNGSTWILDPRNPNQVSGGFGPNSELAMPDYVQPVEIKFYSNIPHGTLRDTTVFSTNLRNSRRIRVYTPPAYATAVHDSFPLVLFHDGLEYISLASANNVLDYLISENRIQPVIAVFVPPVNREDEYAFNLTSQYESFIVDELTPIIDKRYRTRRDPASRAMVGISFGGLITTQICYRHPENFGLCAPFSPAYWPQNQAVLNTVRSGAKKNIKWYLDWGTYEFGIMLDGRMLRDNLISNGYELEWREWHEGHSWGSWRAHLDIALEYFFPGTVVSVDDDAIVPLQFSLHQNYPNPFNPQTTIRFVLPKSAHVTLKVFNLLGEEVATLVNDKKLHGRHEVNWTTAGLSSGVYVYRLTAGDEVATRRLLLLK